MTRTPLLPTLLLCLALIANSVGAAWAATLAGQAGCRHAADRGAAAMHGGDAPAAQPMSHAQHAAGHGAHADAGPAAEATAHAADVSSGGHCGDCGTRPHADESGPLAGHDFHGGHGGGAADTRHNGIADNHDSHAPDGDCGCASGGCACPALHVAQAVLPPPLQLDSAPVHVRLAASGPGVRPAPTPAVPTRPPILG